MFYVGGNVEQIALLCQFGAIAPLCGLLDAKEPKTVLVVLDGLANILAAAEKMGELEKVSLHVANGIKFSQLNMGKQVS